MTRTVVFVPLLLAAGVVLAADPPERERAAATKAPAPAAAPGAEPAAAAAGAQAPADGGAKELSGMSILGNQEAPKALVIVPWKSSELGDAVGFSTMLDDSRQPVDKEVFMRMLSYYEVESQTTRHDGAPATAAGNEDAAQPAAAAHRRKS